MAENMMKGEGSVSEDESPFSRRVFQALFELAGQYKRQFLLVSFFAFLYTGLDLLQPLVYRQAINAVAGLFVHRGPASAPGAGIVPAQTPEQTLRTLLISALLYFLIAVASYFFYQRANYYGARVASFMESKLVVGTFAHVLRLPLGFFNNQASAGLARR